MSREPWEVHLEDTGASARAFLEAMNRGDSGMVVGLLHDVGKYTRGFPGTAARWAALLIKLFRNAGLVDS